MEAISARDYPMVQTVVLLISTMFVSINLVVDVLYRWIDPRVESCLAASVGVVEPARVTTAVSLSSRRHRLLLGPGLIVSLGVVLAVVAAGLFAVALPPMTLWSRTSSSA